MLNLDYLSVNEKNHLEIDGCDAIELALKYGTPLYVMSENYIRNMCNVYKNAISNHYDGYGKVIYASKALNCMEICKIINSENLGIDVVSGGELYTAIKSGITADKIMFHGNNKTIEELNLATDYRISRVIVDNFYELENLNKISKKKNIVTNILLRLKPNVEVHTHHYITTGQLDSKFGFAIETGEAFKAVKDSLRYENLQFQGFSYHIGSQIFSPSPFMYAAEVVMKFINEVMISLNAQVNELDIGGGFGIPYTNADDDINYSEFLFKIFEIIRNRSEKYNIKKPYIYIEPGRSIVGNAGITLYKVGAIKEIPQIRTYVSIDGGMTDNPRYSLYNSKYTIINANHAGDKADKLITLAGKCCESGDIIGKDLLVKMPEYNDIIAVLSTGAYNYSMSSNYNKNLKPAMIMIRNSIPRVIIRRQTFEEMLIDEL